MKNIYKLSLVFMALFIVSCDKNEFAELNTNPNTLSNADLRFLTTKSVEQMFGNDYTVWFYNNFDYVYPWSQFTGTGTGNGGEAFVEMGSAGGQSIYATIYPNSRDIRAKIDAMDSDQKATMQAMRAMTFPILIHPALTQTDNTGSMPYSEAALAAYTSPALLTPKFDTQEELFSIWLEELDEAIAALTKADQFNIGDQDIIYGGDYAKWAKFCNLLKLKIAVRLIGQNKAKALSIAEEVVSSPAGYMNDLNDDFIYRRAINYYGTGNGTQPGVGGKNIIEFLVDSKDPRVRFLFAKNSFNGEVVQAFIDGGKALPPYVEQYVNLDGAGDFSGWSGPGEPWVRYFGAPLAPDAQLEAANDPYFKQASLNKIKVGNIEKTYASTSRFNERVTRTRINHTYPTKPGGRVMENKDNYPAMTVILGSSAETNLYLAEFKLLGANIAGSAQSYFDKGVELSVKRMDISASTNGSPYYNGDPVYTDAVEAEAGATKLRATEIADLMTLPAYDLATDGLEKVYIQQYINFAITPADLWTLVRRSGIPKTGSTYLPRDSFMAGGIELTVPRRFSVGTPTADAKNFENQKSSVEEQGFTTGTSNPETLNTERLWFDKQFPAYGAGPQ